MSILGLPYVVYFLFFSAYPETHMNANKPIFSDGLGISTAKNVGDCVLGRRYLGKDRFLYNIESWQPDVYLANTGSSIIGTEEPDLTDPALQLYYVVEVPEKCFYDHSKFLAGEDYFSASWAFIKHMSHSIFIVKEADGDEVYTIGSNKFIPFIVFGKLTPDCILHEVFQQAISKFKID